MRLVGKNYIIQKISSKFDVAQEFDFFFTIISLTWTLLYLESRYLCSMCVRSNEQCGDRSGVSSAVRSLPLIYGVWEIHGIWSFETHAVEIFLVRELSFFLINRCRIC